MNPGNPPNADGTPSADGTPGADNTPGAGSAQPQTSQTGGDISSVIVVMSPESEPEAIRPTVGARASMSMNR